MTDLPAPHRTLSYGPLDDQLADLYLPSAEPSGLLLLLLHGGDWQHAADRGYLAPMAVALSDLGHVVASVEYRRLGGGGGWPTTFTDVSSALAGVPRLATQAAAETGIEVAATVLVGHSAGGQLALWGASQPIEVSPPLVLAVGIGPSADLALHDQLGLADGAAAALLGGTPGDLPEDVLAQACPTRLVPRVPVRLVHADRDSVVPLALSESYLERVDGDVALAVLSGEDHFTGTIAGGLGWAELTAALDEAEELSRAAQ